ncbi:MAG: hypothetical protein J2P36_39755, partial [Ktedonobacteraceae bacterium]|nr:hypothetical protein [Ktedonobacteraceae bacterium]
MQCQLCGVVLQPGARACASCGTSTSPDHSDDSSYEYGTSPIPYIPYATPVKTSSEASDHSSPPDPSLDVVAHPSTTQPQRNRLSAVLVVVSVILVVFLGIGGGFTYYTLAI